MKIAKKLTTLFVLGLTISNVHAVESNSVKAIAEASFDWGTFIVTTHANPGSSDPAPTIQWTYQDDYANSNSQKNKTIGWNTTLEIAENGISSWSKIDPSTVHSYAKDTNQSPESKSWSSSFRVGGFTVTGNGYVTFSANYSLSSYLSPGTSLPSYADAAALFTVKNLDNIEIVSQKDSIDLNNSNANANNNVITKANKLTITLPVQNGRQYKFSADIHAKAGLSNLLSSSNNPKEAVVLGNWCANVSDDCDGAFRIDLATGKRTLISAYTKADGDKLFDDPSSPSTLNRGGKWWEKIAIASSGDIFVYSDSRYDIKTDNTNKSIYRISPTDGSRQLISNVGDKTNLNVIPDNMVMSPTNKILLGEYGKIKLINPATGQYTLLTDSSNSSQGPAFSSLLGTDPNGDLFGLGSSGLIQIDLDRGARAFFANYGIVPSSSVSLIDSSGNIISTENGVLRKYNNIGSVSLISDFGNQTQGSLITNAKALMEGGDGRFMILDSGKNENLGGLVVIDPNTGNRNMVSDFRNQSQGPLVYDARAIAVGSMPTYVGANITGASSSGDKPILSLTESVDPAKAGNSFSYIVTFSNYAADFATNVKLTNKLLKKSVLISAVPSQGTCKAKVPVVCNFGVVAPGARVTAKITIIHTKVNQIKNTSIVTYKMKKTGTKKNRSYRLETSKLTAVR